MQPLPYSDSCFVCGHDNPLGLKLHFFRDEDEVVSRFELPSDYSGFLDRTHGGILSSLLDEAMGWALWVLAKKSGVTQTLNITYKRPVYVERCVRISSWLDTGAPANSPMKVYARIEDERGRVLAEASGDWVIVRDQRRAAPAV